MGTNNCRAHFEMLADDCIHSKTAQRNSRASLCVLTEVRLTLSRYSFTLLCFTRPLASEVGPCTVVGNGRHLADRLRGLRVILLTRLTKVPADLFSSFL